MNILKKLIGNILMASFFAFFLISCAAPTLNVIPDKAVLSPALIKKPITFTGSGWEAQDQVIIELILPKEVKMLGLSEDEDRVAIGYATTDKDGNFKAAMHPVSTLSTFFQVRWTPLMKPDFKKAKPLPPGRYEIVAKGTYSDKESKGVLELLPAPKKK